MPRVLVAIVASVASIIRHCLGNPAKDGKASAQYAADRILRNSITHFFCFSADDLEAMWGIPRDGRYVATVMLQRPSFRVSRKRY